MRSVKFGARKLGRYCRVWYCCFGEDIAWWQMLFWCFTCCLMSLRHLVHLCLFSTWFSDTRDTFTSLFGDRSGIWKFLHFLELGTWRNQTFSDVFSVLWNQRRFLEDFTVGRLVFWKLQLFWHFCFGYLWWKVFQMFLVIATTFGCSSHPFCFGSQKERRNHNMVQQHSSQDTVTLFVVVWEKGTQSCCRTWSDVLWTQLGFVAVFLTLSLP